MRSHPGFAALVVLLTLVVLSNLSIWPSCSASSVEGGVDVDFSSLLYPCCNLEANLARRTRKGSKKLNAAATGIGAGLGTLAGRVDSLKAQRQSVVTELRHVIAVAQQMLGDLGEEASASAARVRKAGGAPKKRRLSPEGRANIIAAAKKRWAKYNAAKGK